MSSASPRPNKKPKWLAAPLPGGDHYAHVKRTVNALHLPTVCQSARCPNIGECWNSGTATFLLLGDLCTRNCRFCAVTTGRPHPLDPDEPDHIARAVQQMELSYAVLTSVTRDDLPDGGAARFAQVTRAIHALPSHPMVEVLTPDYTDRDLEIVLDARPEVFAHNVEVVSRLTPTIRDHRFSYRRSLRVLEQAARTGGARIKSSLMLGVGETAQEIADTLRDLRSAGVEILVLGQYLQPTSKHVPVARWVHPDEFAAWKKTAQDMGFGHVSAGPLVRTSYKAAEAYVRSTTP